MTYLNGGYVMLDKADSDIFAKALGALQAGKPILWYEDKNTCYFIDTISISGDDIALTKGGLTIVITSGNVVSEVGAVNGAILDDIVDSNGNNRFIEGAGTLEEISGVTFKYNKWSLSGTHLMIVLAGEVEDTTTIPINTLFASYELPEYILSKIIPLFSNRVATLTAAFYGSDYSQQSGGVGLNKEGTLLKMLAPSLTFTATRNFRIQFDLLIDQE